MSIKAVESSSWKTCTTCLAIISILVCFVIVFTTDDADRSLIGLLKGNLLQMHSVLDSNSSATTVGVIGPIKHSSDHAPSYNSDLRRNDPSMTNALRFITNALDIDITPRTTGNASESINHTHFNQWYGSSLMDKTFRVGEHSKCRIPTLICLWNHKSGGHFKEWLPILSKQCGAPLMRYGNTHGSKLCVLSDGIESKHGRNSSPEDTVLMGFMESDPVSLRAATAVFKQKRPSSDYVVLFMVRKPLSTILSGYNYRSAGKEKEQWTDKRLSWTHPQNQKTCCSPLNKLVSVGLEY